jgi:Domain of unknown function (DUF4259)
MGSWGTGLFEDDTALDARGAFEDARKAGLTPAQAAEQALKEMAEELDDEDDGPVVVLALGSLLLDHGVRDHPLLQQAREVIGGGAGLERWEEAGPEALAERRAVYQILAERLP